MTPIVPIFTTVTMKNVKNAWECFTIVCLHEDYLNFKILTYYKLVTSSIIYMLFALRNVASGSATAQFRLDSCTKDRLRRGKLLMREEKLYSEGNKFVVFANLKNMVG